MKLGSFIPNYIKIGITAGFTLASVISIGLVESFFDIDISRPAMIHEVRQLESELDTMKMENAKFKTIMILLSDKQDNKQIVNILLNDML